MRHSHTLAFASFVLACVSVGFGTAQGEDAAKVSAYAQTLTDKGIPATAEGIGDYLRQLHPSEEQRAAASRLIDELGADNFDLREKAMQKLLIMPVLDTDALTKATSHEDPEVRWRAKKVLTLGRPQTELLLYAAFRTIDDAKLSETLPELIRAIPLCHSSHLRQAARTAMVNIARPDDAGLLQPALESTYEHTRAAAAAALGAALGEEADDQLAKLAEDPSDQVKFAAARAMADYGHRRALPLLLELMASDDVEIRTHSYLALRALTGQHFNFAAYDSAERRDSSLKQWREWLAGEGQTAKLEFPLKPFGLGTSFLGGNTLLAFGNRNKVVELDPAGKEVWSYSIPGAWSAEKLANGNVLIASNSQSKVIEVDREGKIVWEYRTQNPLNAKPLPNGNILIAGFTQRKAIEVNRDQKVVWQYEAPHYVCDVHRLENGNTMVASMNGPVREVTPDGKTVWETSHRQVYGCQPLPSGNVLIASLSGEVVEVNRDHKVVWEFKDQNPADAFRLPNGNTLITGSRRFVEVTPDKKIVWSQEGCQYGSARR